MLDLIESEALWDTQLNKSRSHLDIPISLRHGKEARQEKEVVVTHKKNI